MRRTTRAHAVAAVARAEVAGCGVGERGDRLVAHLRRAGTEASVGGQELGREDDVGVVGSRHATRLVRSVGGSPDVSLELRRRARISSKPWRKQSTSTSAIGHGRRVDDDADAAVVAVRDQR